MGLIKRLFLMDSIYDRACFLSPVFSSSHPPLFLRCRYNKQEGDFPSLREYNDYLEQVEDIGTARCRKRASAKIVSRSHVLSVSDGNLACGSQKK